MPFNGISAEFTLLTYTLQFGISTVSTRLVSLNLPVKHPLNSLQLPQVLYEQGVFTICFSNFITTLTPTT